MNFNVTLLKTGVKRRINPHPAERFLDRAVDAIDKPKEDLR